MLKPASCLGCILHSRSNGFAPPDGRGTSGVVIVGESLGEEEYKDAKPFRPYAQAGSKLEEVFRLAGVTRDQFLITNILSCQPPNNILNGAGYEMSAISHCFNAHLSKTLEGFNPPGKRKTILALGNIALRTLTGVSGSAKEKQSIDHLRGYAFSTPFGYVVGSYHPSYLRRGKPNYTPVLAADLEYAISIGRRDTTWVDPASYKPTYVLASTDDAKSYLRFLRESDPSKLLLSYDIETSSEGGKTAELEEDEREELLSKGGGVDITQIQFSHTKGYGIIFPSFNSEYKEVTQSIMALPHIKANHNAWNFDNPILRDKGISITGRVHDTMWMFKHWHPNLDRGLQKVASLFGFPFPWKHLALSAKADMLTYGGADVDSVQWIMATLPRLMKARGVWDGYGRSTGVGGYKHHVYNLHQPTMQRAAERGIPVSEERRQSLIVEFTGERDELDNTLQTAIPEELKNVEPKRTDASTKIAEGKKKAPKTGVIVLGTSYGYVNEPKEIKQLRGKYAILTAKLESAGKRAISFEQWAGRVTGLSYKTFSEVVSCDGLVQERSAERWCRVIPFSPSFDQLSRYVKWRQETIQAQAEQARKEGLVKKSRELVTLAGKYEIPTLRKRNSEGVKEDKETLGGDQFDVMVEETNDPILSDVQKIRSVNAILNNYLPNWEPDADGCVHTTWGYTAPTGQFDSRRPNILNASKHSESGQRFRRMIEAPKGFTFVQADMKSFHVSTMAYCANDASYLRFARLDPHSIFTSHVMPKEWGQPIDVINMKDDDILDRCKWIKNRCKIEKEKLGDKGVDLRQHTAKPVVLGNQLGLGPEKLWKQNRRAIDGIRHAERLQAVLGELFPKVETFKDHVKEVAHRQTYLLNDWGYIQYFFDVYTFRWNKNKLEWKKGNGSDAEKCLAFAVQSPAFGMIKWNLRQAEEWGWCDWHWFNNSEHDSIAFVVRDEEVGAFLPEVKALLVRPCGVLVNEATGPGGLSVGVELSSGKNWQAWHEEKNPEGMREVKV